MNKILFIIVSIVLTFSLPILAKNANYGSYIISDILGSSSYWQRTNIKFTGYGGGWIYYEVTDTF